MSVVRYSLAKPEPETEATAMEVMELSIQVAFGLKVKPFYDTMEAAIAHAASQGIDDVRVVRVTVEEVVQ